MRSPRALLPANRRSACIVGGTASLSMMHHDAPDGLPVRRGLELGSDPAACHDADPIGQIEHLVKVIANQHNRRSAGSGIEQSLLHRRAGANVETSARAVRDDDLGVTAELTRDDQLLSVAAGQKGGLLAQIANALDIEFAHGLGRPP